MASQRHSRYAIALRHGTERLFPDCGIDVFSIPRLTQIPWIALLGPGQKTSKGIYPVYLFYRDLDLLILAYAISESNQPNQVWAKTDGAVSIADMFSERFGTAPKRFIYLQVNGKA
jgi:hypothetical protein